MEIDRLKNFTGQVAQIRAQTGSGTSETLLTHSHTSALPPFTDILGIGPDSRD